MPILFRNRTSASSNMSIFQNFDTATLLQLIINLWPDFTHTGLGYVPTVADSLGRWTDVMFRHQHKSLVFEIKRTRNDWAHQFGFSLEA